MKKLSELLESTPKWQNPDPAIRLDAVKKAPLEDETLSTIARTDKELEVRVAAIKRLGDENTLASLAHDEDTAIQECAVSRQAELVFTLEKSIANSLICNLRDARILMKIATDAPDLELKLHSVKHLESEDSLEQLLHGQNSSKVHQLCAERIEDANRLERIHKDFLGKDKNVVQITRNKLNQIKDHEAATAAFINECESICHAIEKLVGDEPRDDFERKLTFHTERWQALASANQIDDEIRTAYADLETRFEQARDKGRHTLETRAARDQELSDRAAETVAELEGFVAALERDAGKLEELRSFLDSLRHKWPVGFSEDHELTEKYYRDMAHLEGIQSQFERWSKIKDALQAAIDDENSHPGKIRKLIHSVKWPDEITEPPLLQQARERAAVLIREKEEASERRQTEIHHLEGQIERLACEIRDGHTRPATKLQTSITKRMADLNVPKKMQDRFSQLTIQLRELKDWQGFATTPKREELCERMESLRDDAGIHPGEKAKAIKELQDEWRKLGPSDSRDNQRLWMRFKSAGDAAFEPCAEYFKEQSKHRTQNLHERQKICESLELFLDQNDWEHTDWKGVANIVYKAKGEWSRFRDVPNADRKKIQKRFSRVMDQLEKKLEQEQQRNETKKRELIDSIKKLLDEDLPVPELISQTKQIQKEWKDTGITRRAVDQKLWKDFRAQCDLVFARRDKQHEERKDEARAHHEAAREVINKLKSLLQRDLTRPVEKSELNQLRGEFRKIKLDREGAFLNKEFNHLLKEAEALIQQQVKAGEQQMIDELKRKAAICCEIESGSLALEQAEARWSADIALESELSERIEKRRELAASGSYDAELLADYQEAAELICIRMEILADLESPPEAAEKRMQYQVDRLNRELSQGQHETRSTNELLRDLQRQWYCLGPITDNAARLRQRFQAAEAVLEGNRRD